MRQFRLQCIQTIIKRPLCNYPESYNSFLGGVRKVSHILEAMYPYMFVDGIWLKRSWGGVAQSVSVLVAIGVNKEGYREILSVWRKGAVKMRKAGEISFAI